MGSKGISVRFAPDEGHLEFCIWRSINTVNLPMNNFTCGKHRCCVDLQEIGPCVTKEVGLCMVVFLYWNMIVCGLAFLVIFLANNK